MSDPRNADVVFQPPGPALSTSSDMPVIDLAVPPPAEPTTEPAPDGTPQSTSSEEPAAETPESEGTEGEAPTEAAEPPADGEPPAPRPRHGPIPVARFNEVNEQKRAAEEARAEAEAREARTQARLDEALRLIEERNKPPEPPAPEKPLRTAFDDPDAYEAALETWARDDQARRTATELETKRAEEARVQEQTRVEEERTRQSKELADNWQAKQAAAIEAHPDFVEVVASDQVPITVPMSQAILTLENGTEVAYHLGKNPEEAIRIAGFVLPNQFYPRDLKNPDGTPNPMAGQPVPDFYRQSMEMGRLSERLANGTRPAISAAPEPITPVRGREAAVTRTVQEIGDEGSMEEYAAARMKSLKRPEAPFFPDRR